MRAVAVVSAVFISASPIIAGEPPDSGRNARPNESPQAARLWVAPAMSAALFVEAGSASRERGVLNLARIGFEPQLPGGFSARLEFMGKLGHDGLPFPSVQGLSSLDAADFGRVGEAWLAWTGLEWVRIKAGWVDANSEFAGSTASGEFANPSFGLSPALAVLPSYPSPAPSANVFLQKGDFALGAGVYRNAANSWSSAVQVGGTLPNTRTVQWRAGWVGSFGRGWDDAAVRSGAFLMIDRSAEQGGSPFAAAASTLDGGLWHLAAGVSYGTELPWGLRAGVATSALLGRAVADELVAEAFVSVRPVPWLFIQPDVQLHLADGAAPSLGRLVRIGVER